MPVRSSAAQSRPSCAVSGLVAVVEAMDRAVGQREMRHVAEEDGGDAVAVEIERGDCGHVFELLDEQGVLRPSS